MSSHFAKLDFELCVHLDQSEDEDEPLVKKLTFRNWTDSTHISYYKGTPTEGELRILTKLSKLLDELREEVASQ